MGMLLEYTQSLAQRFMILITMGTLLEYTQSLAQCYMILITMDTACSLLNIQRVKSTDSLRSASRKVDYIIASPIGLSKSDREVPYYAD